MLFFVATCCLSSFAVSWLATSLMRRLAPRFGLVDRPMSGHKSHETPTPLGGGVGIWLGVVLPVAAVCLLVFWLNRLPTLPVWLPDQLAVHLDGIPFRATQLWSLIAGGTLLMVMGLMDDSCNLPWLPRLIVQFLVACALVASGVKATVFVPYPWVGYVISVVWMLVLMNAFNFLDNMDGLSSGIAMIASAMFAIVMLTATSEPRWLVGGMLLILTGALLGFWCHNKPPAKIFMGDAGSYFIGLLLASMTLLGTYYEYDTSLGRHVILAPLCILAVPLYDFGSVIVIRLRQGRSPFHPDRNHFSHRLVQQGFSRKYAVLTIYLATLTTGAGTLLLYQVSGWHGAFLVIAQVACILGIVAILEAVSLRRNDDS